MPTVGDFTLDSVVERLPVFNFYDGPVSQLREELPIPGPRLRHSRQRFQKIQCLHQVIAEVVSNHYSSSFQRAPPFHNVKLEFTIGELHNDRRRHCLGWDSVGAHNVARFHFLCQFLFNDFSNHGWAVFTYGFF